MSQIVRLVAALGLLTLVAMAFPAQVEAQMKIKWKGEISSNLFLGLSPPEGTNTTNNLGQFFNYRNSNFAALEMVAKLGNFVKGQARVEIRNVNFSQAFNSQDLQNYNNTFPVSVRLFEAFIQFYELGGLIDLTIGQQRIAWGTTTVFNPTDNLNPFNLENPLDFKERSPVPAIKVTIPFGDVASLTLVNIPMYTPPVLPVNLFRDVTTIDISTLVPKGFTLGKITSSEQIVQPEFNVENMQGAARFLVNLDDAGVNFSLSYFFGRTYIPVPASVPIINAGIDFSTNTVTPLARDVQLVFPRVHAIGADFSAAVFGIDIRAEVAVFVPVEQIDANITLRTNPDDPNSATTINPLTGQPLKTVAFKPDPFVKLVVELEYTFPGGVQTILQYLYGFFNEQNWDQLHHYWLLTTRKTFLNDKLEMRLVGGFELDTTPTSGADGNGEQLGYAFLANLELIWRPFDAGQITLGGIVTRGIKGTTFSLFAPLAQVYLRAKMEFK